MNTERQKFHCDRCEFFSYDQSKFFIFEYSSESIQNEFLQDNIFGEGACFMICKKCFESFQGWLARE